MDDLWRTITSRLKALQEHWAVWTVIGSGALYLLGYLVTRFQLTLFGVATSLDVVEERYFYAGARFVVYLLASLPTLLLFALPLSFVVWLAWLIVGRVPALGRCWQQILRRWKDPLVIRVAGVIFSVFAIQFVMRQCFVLSNLLFAPGLPGPDWLNAVLLEDLDPAVFFALVTGACLISLGIFAASRDLPAVDSVTRALEFLLGLLLVLQLLLLPVNYSCLVANKYLPVVSAPGKDLAGQGQSIWLVWDNKESYTFFVGNRTNLLRDRRLVTVPGKDVERLQITGYDPIFRLLFRQSGPINHVVKP